jgi:uncharacterized lipoprotein YajG
MIRSAITAASLLLLAGCATFKNTPQQDYVYAMARPCENNGVQIAYVAPDGKSWRGTGLVAPTHGPSSNSACRSK